MRSLVRSRQPSRRLEVVLVSGPTLALAAVDAARGRRGQVALIIGALMVLCWVRAADLVRPIVAARNAKRAGRALDAAEIAATERAVRRAPFEIASRRWLLWSAAAVYLAVHLASRGLLAWPSAIGVACITFLHAGGAAAARAALWERRLDGARRLVLPNFDALRDVRRAATAAGCVRRRAMLLAVAHAVNAALISVFTELTSAQSGTLLALTVPALLIPMLVWYGVAARRTAAIERYFEIAVRTRARAARRAKIPTRSPRSAPRRGCPTVCRATRRWRARFAGRARSC